LSVGIFDLHLLFVQAAELKWPKVDIPQAFVDLFQADVFAGTDDGDVDPIAARVRPPRGDRDPAGVLRQFGLRGAARPRNARFLSAAGETKPAQSCAHLIQKPG
jgi:hypothetical protein